jgi:hypothetical protein
MLQFLRDFKGIMYAIKHSKDDVRLTGNVRLEHFRDGECLYDHWMNKPNIFTTEGMAFLNNVMFHDIAKPSIVTVSPWRVGIFKNNVTPALGDTAAAKLGSGGTYGECQDADYDSPATNKPEHVTVDTATAVITNAAAKAEFTIAATITVYGAFLGLTAAKVTASGTLMCAKKFDTARPVVDNDVLAVTYQITCSSS